MMREVTQPSPNDKTCNDLMLMVARGDRDALGSLFRIDAGRLMAIARRIVRRHELAEEAVQDGFVAAWRNASSFDPERGTARAWLTTIVRNRALNLLRDGSRLEFVPDDELAAFGNRSDEAERAYSALANQDELKRCLEQLEPNRRKSVLLSYVVGYSHGEIAAELKVPLGTVKSWVKRSVASLQECMS